MLVYVRIKQQASMTAFVTQMTQITAALQRPSTAAPAAAAAAAAAAAHSPPAVVAAAAKEAGHAAAASGAALKVSPVHSWLKSLLPSLASATRTPAREVMRSGRRCFFFLMPSVGGH